MTGSFMGRGNQYIQLVKVLYCKLPTNGKQLPAFPLEVRLGFELQSDSGEARVLPLCHHAPPPPPPHDLYKNSVQSVFTPEKILLVQRLSTMKV